MAAEISRGFGGAAVFGSGEQAKAAAWLEDRLGPGDWVLIKGSRAMALERVFSQLQRKG
jgi:UDP-N-acetylmuramyl pentapeptide synthase